MPFLGNDPEVGEVRGLDPRVPRTFRLDRMLQYDDSCSVKNSGSGDPRTAHQITSRRENC